ncbi:WASH complex subunit 2-like isoform X3 [Lytechinus variegatus]|uniref:WASH complex subunit 2-like isoform X3 n=1 Tax=Lytechinus variegatus TaxID=7654 RepID=UPI001BB27896|nr:WASH complex subunit 2-like isoform X3 [Lytechinus variegatus]
MAENRNVARVRDSDGSPPGLSHKDSDEWGSIADLLKSIESTNQSRCTKVKSPPPPQPRMPPLSENIQSADAGESQRGQGMQQLNHLIRLMDQMCALQRQNSKLREQAEYLAAIKNLHELRNETLRQNCHCEGHRRASDLSSSSGSRFEHTHVTGESLSEPESQMGEDMDGDMAARGEKRGRSSKRDGKNKNIKKRSRSLDPFGDEGDSKDRNKQGLFSKIEKMKEKLTNRRGSVKRRSNSRGDGAKSDDEGEEGKSGPPFHVDGLETKSEDSGIYHIGPDDLAAAARLEAFMQKSTDDISDNEDIFQGTVPLNWARTAVLAQSRRKGSDLSTGSSGEDYLESKPKRTSPSEERKSNLATVSQQETDEISSKRSRFRRTPSCQDNGAAFDDIDGERAVAARSMGPVEEKLKQKRLLQSHSLDIEMTDAGGVSERESGRMSGSEYKQPQKRKYFRKSQTVDVDLDGHSTSSVSVDGAFKDVRSPKASPPEKKKHRGWEKVKHAMTKRHLAEANRQRLMTSSTEESPPVAKRQEMAEDGYLTPGDSTDDGMRKVSSRRGDGSKKSSKRDKGPAPLQKQGSLESGSDVPSSRPVDIESELNKGLTEEFSKKLAEWEKMKKSGYGATSPKGEPKQKRNVKEKKDSTKNSKDKEKQKTKESPLLSRRSKSPEAKLSRNIVVIEDADGQLKLEGASKEFSKRFQEWEKMRSQSSMNTSDSDSPSQRVRKQGSEDSSEPGPQRERAASPRRTDDPSKTTPSRKDNNQAQKKAGATSHEAGSQSEFPDDGRPGDDAVFAEAEEHITKLEEKNTFLATQLKRKDVNLQAVQSELETMQHQLEQIGGSKRDLLEKSPHVSKFDLLQKRTSTCSSIGESLLEEELNDIKSQVEKLEQQYQLRMKPSKRSSLHLRSPPPSSSSSSSQPTATSESSVASKDSPVVKVPNPEVTTSGIATSNPKETQTMDVVDACVSTEPLKLPGRTEAEVQTKQSAPTEDLKRSLQERENIIKLLQTELERQSQEISFLRNQGNTFKRAKSFSARDRTYNPAQLEPSIGWNPALQRNKVKDSTSTISVSESTDSRQDGAPSLEALHISAEDIRMDVDSTKKTAQSSRNTSQSSTSKQNVSSTNKDPDAKSTYPGLYGPIETSSRRRRGNDIKEETSAGQTKAAAQQKKEPEKEVDQPKDESVDEIVARRRARREARRNVRLGIHSAQDKPPIPEPKEEVKPTQTKGTADKMTAKSSSITGPVKAQDSVSESPRVRRRRDRQSGHSTQSPVEAPQEPPLKLPLSPRTRDRQEREVFSDTTNDSEQESISLRSDSDIRRRFESILAHRRRESTDSVSSSRRSSPSGRLYDSNFSRTRTNGDVQNLRKKFTGSSPANVAQAGPVKQKSKSLKYEKERPREGSVKALSQTFGSGDEKKTGGNSNKSSPRSLSPASSSGSLSTGIADKIKKLKNTEEKPIERRKSADLIKARVAQMEQPKDTHSETPQRKSMPAIQAVRSKFEKGGNQDTALSPTRKAGGKISYTVSVTDSDKENSESSRTDDRSYRQKSKSSRLVAVVETADSTKKPDTVTFTVNSHGRRRYGAMADNTNNSNSKHAEPPVTEDLAKPVETEKLKKDDVHTVPTKEEREHKEPKTPSGKREEDAKEGRRRRRERHKASEANKKAQETSKPEPATSEPEKHNTKKNDTKETKAEEPQNKVEKEESKPEVKTDTGKKGRRRRRGKGQSVDIPDEPKQSSQNKPNVEVLQEKGKEKEEKEEKEKEKSEKRYEKKEDVTKPSERHIQKKDKESTLTALKRMVSKREDVRPDVKVRDPTRARLEAENKSSSIDSIEGQDYPDLLAQTRLHDKDKGNSQDEGNGRRRPRSMVAESGLKGAAAAIGQAIPKPESEDKEKEKEKEKEKPKEAEEDDRRSRKETTRRGRFLAKADKFELFRRARSVGPGSKNKERSPSAERKSKGIRSSSIDRSKMRAKSPDPIKSKKKGGSIGGFLKASNSETDDDDEDDDIEYDSEEYDSESDVGSGIDDDTDDDVEDDLWTDMEECYRILFNCHSVLSKLQCRERKHALTWPISAMRQAALLS